MSLVGTLSPSRAADFLACPLLYRFRSVDRLPDAPSPDAVRGTLVHKVLEDLYDLPAVERTPDRAGHLVEPTWQALVELEPELAGMFGDDADEDLARWMDSCHRALAGYFALEDPSRIEPAERELPVETLLESGLLLRGIIDRLDVAPDGAMRVVDYKTGRAPGELFEAKALFQMRFYALVLWRSRGIIPRMLQLIYIGSGEWLRYEPDEADLLATERKVLAVWDAIARAKQTQDFQPRPGAICGWCNHRDLCPAHGGTPPPYPESSETHDHGP
ncbi:MAG: PD-(D/E)XK nuclease family protein [Nocardioidaceae bacterium]